MPKAVKRWSLRCGQIKVIKSGGRLVRHVLRLVFHLAEEAMPREVFRPVLERIGGLPAAPAAGRAQKFPSVASWRMRLSSVRSATMCRSRAFSCSRCLSRRT